MDQDYWSATITLEASYHQPPGHWLWIWLKKEMKHRSPTDISQILSGMLARQQVSTVARLNSYYVPSTQVALARTEPRETWAMFSKKSFQSRGRTGQENEDPRVNYLRDGQRVLQDHRGAAQSSQRAKEASSRANQSAGFLHQEVAGCKGEGPWASCRGRNKGLWKLAKQKRHGHKAKRNCTSCAAHVQSTPHTLWRDDHWDPVEIFICVLWGS